MMVLNVQNVILEATEHIMFMEIRHIHTQKIKSLGLIERLQIILFS